LAVTGADMRPTLDGRPVPLWTPVKVAAGSTLDLKAVQGPGCRAYVAFAGGLDVPEYLGSRATFTLGRFGGHGGRALQAGDVLRLAGDGASEHRALVPAPVRPVISHAWEIAVLDGPHGAPDYFTAGDIDMLYATD